VKAKPGASVCAHVYAANRCYSCTIAISGAVEELNPDQIIIKQRSKYTRIIKLFVSIYVL